MAQMIDLSYIRQRITGDPQRFIAWMRELKSQRAPADRNLSCWHRNYIARAALGFTGAQSAGCRNARGL